MEIVKQDMDNIVNRLAILRVFLVDQGYDGIPINFIDRTVDDVNAVIERIEKSLGKNPL